MSTRTKLLALAGGTLLLLAARPALPQDAACPPNAHLEGDSCRCDGGYVSLNGSDCVSESSVCSAYGAAHPVGGDCVCNEGYAIFDGSQRCVDAAAHCAQINAVFKKGEGCVCRPGEAQFGKSASCVSVNAHCGKFGAVFVPSTGNCECPPHHVLTEDSGRCIPLTALCARYDAVYNAGKGECECPPGTVEDERVMKCVPGEAGPAKPPASGGTAGGSAPPPEAPSREASRDEASRSGPVSDPPIALPTSEAAVSPPSATAIEERPAPGSTPLAAESVSAPAPSARPASPARGAPDALPSDAPSRPTPVAPPRSTAGVGRLEGPAAPASSSPERVASEPVTSVDSLLFAESEISEEARKVGRSVILEAAADESRAERRATERQFVALDDFMKADLSHSAGDGEVQIVPVLDSMMEARRQVRVRMEHEKKVAARREAVRAAKASGTLRPGADRSRYELLKDSIEATRQTLAWAEKEVAHQHGRLFEALHANENVPSKVSFRLLGKEHTERFKVPVGQEKRYSGLSEDMVPAVASRDCFANIEGARKQIRTTREQLRLLESELESLLDIPEQPRIEDTDRAIIHWYSEERDGS